MPALSTVGRTLYGAGIVAFGLLHLGYGDFVTRVVPWWPAAIPFRSLWAYVAGMLLVAAGAALLFDRRTRIVSQLLSAGLLLSFALLGLPLAAGGPVLGGGWTVAGKALALCGGALLIGRPAWSLGVWFFAAFLVLCGIQHFVHVEFVTSIVPAWIPGARFWTYAAGVALIAGGLGLVYRPTTWLAGVLTGLMIFSWVFLVHLPRAASTFPRTTNETTAVFEALAMAGIAWVAAAAAVRPEMAGARRAALPLST